VKALIAVLMQVLKAVMSMLASAGSQAPVKAPQKPKSKSDVLSLIKEFEGLRLKAYTDVAGIWTIGYGHTGRTNSQTPDITAEEANELLEDDVRWAVAAVDRVVRVPITDNQKAALISFCFNVGVGALTGSTLLRKLNAGDYTGAAKEFKRWNKVTSPTSGKKIVSRGLSRRRAAEAKLFRKP